MKVIVAYGDYDCFPVWNPAKTVYNLAKIRHIHPFSYKKFGALSDFIIEQKKRDPDRSWISLAIRRSIEIC